MNEKPHILGLDLLRIFAALCVVMFHLTFLAAVPGQTASDLGPALPLGLGSFGWFGWIGVEVFFVISGFVIAQSANGATPFAFLRSRVVRLVPALWICATLAAGIPVALGHATAGAQFALWINTMILYPTGNWLDVVYWTLTVEVMFYALVFLLLCTNQFRRADLAFGALVVLSTGFWLVHWASWALDAPALHATTTSMSERQGFKVLLFTTGCFFTTGVFIWLILTRGITAFRAVFVSLSLLGAMLAITSRALYVEAKVPGLLDTSPTLPAAVWCACVAAMVISVVFADSLNRRIGRHARWIRAAGLMTYPLYLIHNLPGVALIRVAVSAGLPPALAVLVAVIAAILAAAVIALALEPVGQRWLRAAFRAIGNRLSQVSRAQLLFRTSAPA